MSFLTSLIILLLSFTGIGFGIILSYLAPDEIISGEKYLWWFKYFLLGLVFLSVCYGLLVGRQFLLVSGFVIVGIVLFVLTVKIGLANRQPNFDHSQNSTNLLSGLLSKPPFNRMVEFRCLKKKNYFLEIGHYLLFSVAYFFLSEQLLLASLIFLYGLPTGTLLRKVYRI